MFFVTEQTMKVLASLAERKMSRTGACNYLGISLRTLNRAAKRDGYWCELEKLFNDNSNDALAEAEMPLEGIRKAQTINIPLEHMTPEVRALTRRWV